MPFFKFNRKPESSGEVELSEIPLFSSLTAGELKAIQKKARLIEYKRGDIIYREGEESDAFYVVISGRFRIYTEAHGNEDEQTLIYLYRGDHFGEASLLTDVKHSASVEAKRDGAVLKLDKVDFLRFVKDMPAISLHINRTLGHRITKSESTDGRRREVKIASLYSYDNSIESQLFWMDFAKKILQESSRKVIVVDFVPGPSQGIEDFFKKSNMVCFDLEKNDPSEESKLKSCIVHHESGVHYLKVPEEPSQSPEEKKISALLTALTYRYDSILLRHIHENNLVTLQTLKRSDEVYVFSPPKAEVLVSMSDVLVNFRKNYGFSASEIKVIIPESKNGISFEEMQRLLGLNIFSLLPHYEEREERYQGVLRFLSRDFTGSLIGLALGSGAAYGLAHIGILRVFERENIPIDMISGSSIGALVGSFWAAGFSSDELEKVAKSINRRNAFFKLVGFSDLSLAHKGFIKGNQVTKFMESYFGDLTFQDLRIPMKITATDLFNSEEIVFEAGRLVNAIRASISIPGIFRPYEYRENFLIDGGVIDPLPVRVLSTRGVKKIIGVNVLTSSKDKKQMSAIKQKSKMSVTELKAQKKLLSSQVEGSIKRMSRRHSVNVFNVIMNTIQFMEYELAEASGAEADVLLHPQTEGHWAQFYEPDKFIKAGEQEAEKYLDDIKQLIEE